MLVSHADPGSGRPRPYPSLKAWRARAYLARKRSRVTASRLARRAGPVLSARSAIFTASAMGLALTWA